MKPKIERPKKCTGCQHIKARSDFYRRKDGQYCHLCKVCDKAKNGDKQRRNRLKGMTVESLKKEFATVGKMQLLILKELDSRKDGAQ